MPAFCSISFFHRSTMRVARGRDVDAGQPLAQDQAQRLGERRVVLVADLGEVGAEQPVVQHLVDVAGHAGHAHAAQRLDARLLQRIERRAGLGLGRRALAVDVGIMAREPHRHGVALAAGDGDVAARRQARQIGEPRLVGGQQRPVGREADLELGLAGNGAHRRAHGGFERLGRVGLVGFAARGWPCSAEWACDGPRPSPPNSRRSPAGPRRTRAGRIRPPPGARARRIC